MLIYDFRVERIELEIHIKGFGIFLIWRNHASFAVYGYRYGWIRIITVDLIANRLEKSFWQNSVFGFNGYIFCPVKAPKPNCFYRWWNYYFRIFVFITKAECFFCDIFNSVRYINQAGYHCYTTSDVFNVIKQMRQIKGITSGKCFLRNIRKVLTVSYMCQLAASIEYSFTDVFDWIRHDNFRYVGVRKSIFSYFFHSIRNFNTSALIFWTLDKHPHIFRI